MIDVEVNGARQMAPAILSPPIKIGADMMPGAIEDSKVGV
jgi:hypothetical protein